MSGFDAHDDVSARGPDAVAQDISGAEKLDGVHLSDFYAHMPSHSYIFAPARDFWPAASVNARCPPMPARDSRGHQIVEDGKPKFIKASLWLDQERPVEQLTWAPGEPTIIDGRLVSEGGWINRGGVAVFNLYRPAIVEPGDAAKAGPWIRHIERIYPDDARHIIRWLAHRVQRPDQKINHALVLGGNQGIGKDSILEPVKYAVGPWNFADVSPQHLFGRFNGFVKSVILRVSEARDLGDVDRFAFYDHMKTYTAAPPDVLRVDEKNIREYSVFNVCGVIITSNHKTDGIYLPADDRRHYVAWSDVDRATFEEHYWTNLYRWYEAEGLRHVAAYLRALDLSAFDAKAPPPKTEAFHAIVAASRTPEDSELADALDALGRPDAVTISNVAGHAVPEFADWLRDRRNSRRIPHRLEESGYVASRNASAKDGQWIVGGKRCGIYVRKDLSTRDGAIAAKALAELVRK